MRLIDWVMKRVAPHIGEASGDRINEAIANREREEQGLAPQRRAWLIDLNGATNYHDLDVGRDGGVRTEVRIKHFSQDGSTDLRLYKYKEVVDGYLVYYQIQAP